VNETIFHQIFLENDCFMITNYHELQSFQYKKNKFSKTLSHLLSHEKNVKKLKMIKMGNCHFFLIIYQDNFIQMLQYNYNYLNLNYKLMHQNEIQLKNDIVDCEIHFPYLFIGTTHFLHVFETRTFDKEPKLLNTYMLNDIPYYTSLTLIKNNLVFNGNKFIPRFQIKFHDAQKKLD
jgi:hypothetical protein